MILEKYGIILSKEQGEGKDKVFELDQFEVSCLMG